MPLSSGSRLGLYEIVAPLGAGGMGEVYRARDTKLGRDVAIKVLPPAFAADPERLARFEREAKVLASLSHPNIAGIFGLHEENGTGFLAMEMVAGEDLAEILKRGPLPSSEVADIARQIAEALEAAHEQGIVHRDLKPANVRITPDGKVKVLDFGLAKALESATTSDSGAGMSPTITSLGTVAGVILGTAAYMAPEQARGKGVDKRADIWAFGCVLFEMLSGKRPFDGETVSDTLAAVLAKDADWSALPASTPAKVRHLLERCLEKDPKRRLRDIGDARLELDEVLADRTASGRVRVPPAAEVTAPARSRWAIPAMIACLVVGGVVGAFAIPRKPAAAGGTVRLDLEFPKDVKVAYYAVNAAGSTIGAIGKPRVAPGEPDQPARVYVRGLGSGSFSAVPGTEGVVGFGFTADGRSLTAAVPATVGSSQLNIVLFSLDGQRPPLTEVPFNPRWSAFGDLRSGGFLALRDSSELDRFDAASGKLEAPVKIDRAGETGPITLVGMALPGDEAILLHAIAYGEKGWYYRVGVLDLRSHKVTYLLDDAGFPRYSPTGHIVFSRGDTLLAVPFDAKSLKLTGAPVPIANGIQTQYAFIPAQFGLSDNGVLIYEPGGRTAETRHLGVIDAAGRVTPIIDEPHAYQSVRADPSGGGRFIATITNGHGIDEMFTGRVDEGGLRRVQAYPQADIFTPVIAWDGHTVCFGRRGRDADDGFYVKDLDGTAEPRRIAPLPPNANNQTIIGGVTRDGAGFVLTQQGVDQKGDIYYVPIPAPGAPLSQPKAIVSGPADESFAGLSPDGRFLGWISDESGRKELYVATFGAGGAVGTPVRVTRGGADQFVWYPDGRGVRLRDADGRFFDLPLTTTPSIVAGAPKLLFEGAKPNVQTANLFPDGRQLLLIRGENELNGEVGRLAVVLGFNDELAAKMKAAR
ncbi:MAG TPA: protein kinase [Candidatus Polarisedimenticolaceae bacterium]|nr:protein kinase [Candidatus Polarisedimenticolaceae bacterium]